MDKYTNPHLFTRKQRVNGGRKANRILEYHIDPSYTEGGVVFGGAPVLVYTPAHKWHEATPRERRLLREEHGVSLWPQTLSGVMKGIRREPR